MRGCLTNINFEKGTRRIGDNAFKDCDLTSLTLPSSLTSIGSYAFCGSRRLTRVVIQAMCGRWAPTPSACAAG